MIQSVFEELLSAYRRKVPDAAADVYSVDAELLDLMGRIYVPGSDGVYHGRAEIAEYWRGFFRPIPHNPTPLILKSIVARPHLIIETDEERLRRCHVIEVRNDKILSHHLYLGSLPSRWLLDKLSAL
jgi:hypothetical protein